VFHLFLFSWIQASLDRLFNRFLLVLIFQLMVWRKWYYWILLCDTKLYFRVGIYIQQGKCFCNLRIDFIWWNIFDFHLNYIWSTWSDLLHQIPIGWADGIRFEFLYVMPIERWNLFRWDKVFVEWFVDRWWVDWNVWDRKFQIYWQY